LAGKKGKTGKVPLKWLTRENSCSIGCRILKTDKIKVQELTAKMGISVSDYIHDLITKDLKK